jgi:hypothetical protein
MSGISAVGSLNYNPFQYLSQLASQSGAANSTVQSTSAASGTTGSTGTTASTGTSLQDQLAAAITTAVQGVEQSGSTSNLDSAIQNAVDQVLQNNGINPQTLQSQQSQSTGQAQGAHHHHHHHHGGSVGQSGDSTSSQQTSDTDALSGTASSTTCTTASQQSSSQQLADLLSQISGTAGGNQSVSGFLLDLQT